MRPVVLHIVSLVAKYAAFQGMPYLSPDPTLVYLLNTIIVFRLLSYVVSSCAGQATVLFCFLVLFPLSDSIQLNSFGAEESKTLP